MSNLSKTYKALLKKYQQSLFLLRANKLITEKEYDKKLLDFNSISNQITIETIVRISQKDAYIEHIMKFITTGHLLNTFNEWLKYHPFKWPFKE